VHPRAETAVLLLDGDRVVEVLRRLRVDRERRQLAEVDTALDARIRRVVRLEAGTRLAVDEEAFEDGLDVGRAAENGLELRAPAAGPDDGEVARAGVAEPLPVEDERRPRDEERVADDELAAAADLDDGPIRQG
jgi:hypothetical protein